jgi:hypothetical protein
MTVPCHTGGASLPHFSAVALESRDSYGMTLAGQAGLSYASYNHLLKD